MSFIDGAARAACTVAAAIAILLLAPAAAQAAGQSQPVGSTATPAEAPAPGSREKVSVLILGSSERDADLAENITEVIIAWMVEQRGAEVTGREEFRDHLGVDSEKGAQLCIDDIACLGRAAVALGIRRIVAGNVGTRGKQFLFNLNLTNVETGKVENHLFHLIEGGVPELISAIRQSTEELFKPRVEPGRIQIKSLPQGARVSIDHAYLGVTPLISGTLLAGEHDVRVEADGRFPWVSRVEVFSGQDLGINLTEQNLPQRRRWPTYAAATTGAAAGVALAAGSFLGVLSQLAPSGQKMREMESDFEQKRKFGVAANVSFIAGAALATATIALLVGYRHDIFGDPDDTPPTH